MLLKECIIKIQSDWLNAAASQGPEVFMCFENRRGTFTQSDPLLTDLQSMSNAMPSLLELYPGEREYGIFFLS